MDNRASMTCGLGLITLQFATYETLCLCLEQILPVAKPVAGLWRSTCKPHSPGLYWFELFVSAHFGCFYCFLFSFQFQLFGSRWQALSKIVVSFTRFFLHLLNSYTLTWNNRFGHSFWNIPVFKKPCQWREILPMTIRRKRINEKNHWKLIPKTIGNRKKRLCVRLLGDKHHLRKFSDRNAQISPVSGMNAFLVCALRFADFLGWCLSPERNLTHNLFFLFPIVLVLIWFIFSMRRRTVQPKIRSLVSVLRSPFTPFDRGKLIAKSASFTKNAN